MNTETNVQIVKGFFAAVGNGDIHGLLTLVAEDVEWIIPGEDWPLAGTYRGHEGITDVFRKASDEIEMSYPTPPEYVAQGNRVLVIGAATGRIKATNKPFSDNWVFDITVRDGRIARIREYIDTQALAQAAAGPAAGPVEATSAPEDRSDLRAS
jgi:ketosteroid isomerase-like protein